VNIRAEDLVRNIQPIGSSLRELIWLIAHADVHGNVNASMNTIAAELGKTRVSVLQNIKQLEQNKFLSRVHTAGRACQYKVQIPGDATNA
jgi:DNA-binding MarR family transcriptional regulator